MKLHNLKKPSAGHNKANKRLGRGQGSTRGGTSTKGHKGAQSRSGYKYRPWFEGGQMPLYRRIPKFGFKNRFRVEYTAINLDTISYLLEKHSGVTVVDHQFLEENGIISKSGQLVKVLGRGEISQGVTVVANKFSKSARAAIEAVGGTVTEV